MKQWYTALFCLTMPVVLGVICRGFHSMNYRAGFKTRYTNDRQLHCCSRNKCHEYQSPLNRVFPCLSSRPITQSLLQECAFYTHNQPTTQRFPKETHKKAFTSKAFTSTHISPSPLYPSSSPKQSVSSIASPLRPPPQRSLGFHDHSSSSVQTASSAYQKLAS